MSAVPQNVSLWTYRRIPYSFVDGYPYAGDVRNAMDQWEKAAGVYFVPRTTEANYIVILSGNSSSSPIGMQGGRQTVTINAGYKALHELGHSLGLIHEQSRSDRDNYVIMEWNSIENGRSNHNFSLDVSTNLTDYDQKSVMHYPAPATGWGGYPDNQEVWTMRWSRNQSERLGAGAYQGWGTLSDLDKSPNGLYSVYQRVPVPMGPETAHGTWKFAYQVQFPFTIGNKTYFFGQNMNEKNWFIQELLPGGLMGAETDHGTFKSAYQAQFPFTVGGNVYFFGQNLNDKNWFIRELLPGGKMGNELGVGTWKFGYGAIFPFTIGGRVFYYGQNLNERNWFIQELLPGGRMGTETANGTWKFAYKVQFPFTIGNRVFFYGQNMNERNWFIQELLPGGLMGNETAHGTWNNAYEVQFPYNINGHQYFYGQNLNTKYWFIQRLNSDGTMGVEIQNGFWKFAYAAQFPFQIGNQQFFYGQNMNEKNWFIQQLIDLP